MEQQYVGVVVHYVIPRGFGFVFCDSLMRRVFFHISNWRRLTSPIIGEIVEFELRPGSVGKQKQAVNVRPNPVTAAAIDALTDGVE